MWNNYLDSGIDPNNTDRRLRTGIRFFNSFTFIGVVSTSIFAVVNLVGANKAGIFELVLAFFAVLNGVYMRYSGNFEATGRNLLILMYGVLTVILLTGGIGGTGIYWFYTFPVLAFFLKGKRGVVYLIFLYMMTLTYLFLHTYQYLPMFAYSPLQIRQMLSSLSAVSLLVFFYEMIRQEGEEELGRHDKAALMKGMLDQQFVEAAEIQKTFIPKGVQSDFMDIAGYYEPALEIGGDYFDFIPLEGGKTAIIICDVAGKGIPAAMVMIKIRTLLKAIPGLTEKGPAEVLSVLNNYIVEAGFEAIFITAFYLIIDSTKKITEFANAGHLPMVYCRNGEVVVDPSKFPGLPLGISSHEARYNNHDIELRKDDLIVLFTDGLTEVRGIGSRHYGRERIEGLLTKNCQKNAGEILQILLDDMRSFALPDGQVDDLSIIVVKIKE